MLLNELQSTSDNPLPPPVPDLAGLIGKDAQATLADALVKASVSINGGALKVALFLPEYIGPEGQALVDRALMLKAHQTPGVVKHLMAAIQALSLREFMSKVNINLGGAK